MDLLKNLFKGDKVIWIIFLLLCLVSIIEVFSASSTSLEAYHHAHDIDGGRSCCSTHCTQYSLPLV